MPPAWIVVQVILKMHIVTTRQPSHSLRFEHLKWHLHLITVKLHPQYKAGFHHLIVWRLLLSAHLQMETHILPPTSKIPDGLLQLHVCGERGKKKGQNFLNKSISWESSETAGQRLAKRTPHTRRGGVTTALPTPPKPPAAESTEAPSIMHTHTSAACMLPAIRPNGFQTVAWN